jgi:hypothetical protein
MQSSGEASKAPGTRDKIPQSMDGMPKVLDIISTNIHPI